MKNYIRILTMIIALTFGAVSGAWAQLTTDDIEIGINPDAAGTITKSVNARVVTLTVSPADGYFIRTSDFVIEKLIDPENANAPKRRVGEVTDVIKGKMYNSDMTKEITSVEGGIIAKYVFTLPDGYDGAYVTATFHLLTEDEGNIIRITSSTDLGNTPDMTKHYVLVEDVSATVVEKLYSNTAFTGIFEGEAQEDGNFPKISGLTHALFKTVTNGTVKNIALESVGINITSSNTNVGAIVNEATGASRIYNCGILSGSVSGTKYVGGIVGQISGTTRVINCYNFANITGGSTTAGIVGYNREESSTQANLKTMVMNCMFYGNITGGSTKKPVYGGYVFSNAGASGINNYNYYRNGKDVTFDDSYSDFADYNCTLPADEEYLTRFEYYRSIFNSNKKLCTWWINGTSGTAPTDVDVETVGIAKWVLDPEIAPYPILKKWGKYPSVINQDPEYVWNPNTKQKVNRTAAEPYQGKRLGTISVTVRAGAKHAGTGITTLTLPSVVVMDMDTLNHDYCYAKIQLPYYNELFGDPTADADTQWDNRYGGNYKDYVVTGWKITSVSGGTPGSFKGYSRSSSGGVSAGAITPDETSDTAWEDGFNFADRNCTNKDLYSKSGRVFAQGGYYYVPEGVTSITIEAYWGKAVYLHNKDHSLDRVNVAAQANGDGGKNQDNLGPDFGSAFTPAGTLAMTFLTYDVKDNLQDAIAALTDNASYTVYDQAIVLVGNVQVKNRGGSLSASGTRPFTIMSCDLDMDNEPDYCLQFQQRNTTNRPAIHPARFDFLPVPELGLTIRTNTFAYTIGLMVPKGHFEITETSFMHTTQFEYDANISKTEAPLILNGGHFEQIVVRYGPKDKTSYILMGGNFRMKRFTPGYHATPDNNTVRHCAVNAIGGEYPEFYLSGIYAPDKGTRANDNPHCYTNGGYFGLIAGAGYEQVKGDVTFKIDHSIIDEFYGGGINAAKPVTGKIDVTINNSLVGKYCGGPKVGVMSTVNNKLKTVTTNASGTTFGTFYGGGNGGTSYYRERILDNTGAFRTSADKWEGYSAFNPLNQVTGTATAYKDAINAKWGYHAEYEFEVFNSSNGLKSGEDVIRVYYRWAQFGTTTTGDVTNNLTDCTIKGDFFGGGNLANVTGDVKSSLKGDTHVYGSVFAGGFSASIPSFRVHDKSTVRIPSKDKAGNVNEQGSLDYYQDAGEDRYYTWCYKNKSGQVFPQGVEIPDGTSTTTAGKSAFQYHDKWYVLTTVSLEDLGTVSGNTSMTIDDNCVIDGNVYGGGDASVVDGNTEMNLFKGSIMHDVYGGGNVANISGDTKVILLGGTINGDVYGGGKGRMEEGTSGQEGYVSPVAAKVGATLVNLNGMAAEDYTIEKYGTLGLVRDSETGPYTVDDSKKGCIVKGSIFGCNNLNGTPLGTATVHIYKTQNANATRITNPAEGEKTAKVKGRYDVVAVYGGGNLAAYEPNATVTTGTDEAKEASKPAATVIIDGCDRTSIQTVYGGGNAACTPATSVTVNGTYEIDELFGGGNGKDDIVINNETRPNPGANVGYKNYSEYYQDGDDWKVRDKSDADTKEKRLASDYVYGSGQASVNIFGGTVHSVFGGSNTKGNVRKTAVTMLDDNSGCDFCVDEAYGGGKHASMDAEAQLLMACIPGLKAVYGGAEAADLHDNVTLNITNGTFERVFGGNNISGTIRGSITVNIEETGCKPIIIGELYGGGNQAGYSVYGYKEVTEDGNKVWRPRESATDAGTGPSTPYADPHVNVKSFSSIGNIYGGGYGEGALMVGNPTVNINEVVGTPTNYPTTGDYDTNGFKGKTLTIDGHQVVLPSHTKNKIGAINNVFGGGNAARVIGNTNVNIATESTQTYVSVDDDPDTTDATENVKTVVGADIRGNVYGGGNNAAVTGNTNVQIGKKNE